MDTVPIAKLTFRIGQEINCKYTNGKSTCDIIFVEKTTVALSVTILERFAVEM